VGSWSGIATPGSTCPCRILRHGRSTSQTVWQSSCTRPCGSRGSRVVGAAQVFDAPSPHPLLEVVFRRSSDRSFGSRGRWFRVAQPFCRSVLPRLPQCRPRRSSEEVLRPELRSWVNYPGPCGWPERKPRRIGPREDRPRRWCLASLVLQPNGSPV